MKRYDTAQQRRRYTGEPPKESTYLDASARGPGQNTLAEIALNTLWTICWLDNG